VTFQSGVRDWVLSCFGIESARDHVERRSRFLEEALELFQACNGSETDALALVAYVYSRKQGGIEQETGGVLVTLASLCSCCDVDMNAAGAKELERIWTKFEEIRAKQRSKLARGIGAGSPLP
jgi:NTP pyrophosphatase (non-canonical NTP hydrolase)